MRNGIRMKTRLVQDELPDQLMKRITRSRTIIGVVVVGLFALAALTTIRGKATVGDSVNPSVPADLPKAVATAPHSTPARSLFVQSISREGIAVEFSIQHVDPTKAQAKELEEGDDARIRFTITDTASGRPVRAINPAAWMDLVPKDEIRGAKTCEQKVKAFLGGSIFGRAELDLNVYNVLTLNDEASISVVDPLFSFGGTKLLGMVVLESPGEDWALTSNETRILCFAARQQKGRGGRHGRLDGGAEYRAGPPARPARPASRRERALGPRRGSRHKQARDIRGHGDRHNHTGAGRANQYRTRASRNGFQRRR